MPDPPQKWSIKASTDLPRTLPQAQPFTSQIQNASNLPQTYPNQQPIKFSSMGHVVMFTRFRFHTRIIESLNLSDSASTLTQKTLRIEAPCSERIQ